MDGFTMRVKELRERAGLTQNAIAESLGMTRAGYQMIENGKTGKKFAHLPNLAKALGCRIDDLFPEMDEPGAGKPSEDAAPEPETEADDWPDGWRD